MVSYKDYVAGWIDSSLHVFFEAFPASYESMKYALITCLDSNLDLRRLVNKSPELKSLTAMSQALGKGLLVPTRSLLEVEARKRLFFGFDEVWFFPNEKIEAKPDAAWLVGPARIDQAKLDKLGKWISDNACTLALGDGDGMNFVVKARGLIKHLIGHSIGQPRPEGTLMASDVAG
jgi:hypothetical protein